MMETRRGGILLCGQETVKIRLLRRRRLEHHRNTLELE
jgi:hypothetical protein